MNKVPQKWIDMAKVYVRQYAEAATEQGRENVLDALVDEDLAVLEAMVQYCAGIDDWMEKPNAASA